jgi:3-oxoacyl-[acyl-carrier-protein] synthase III
MQIATISYRIPSRRIANQDVIEILDRHNAHVPRVRKGIYFRIIIELLEMLGAENRYVRDIAKGEKAVDLILGAMDEAFERASIAPAEIDLLIFCGVGKGFLEPANAYFYAQQRRMRRTHCFDVSDACMSWVRALNIACLMLRAQACRTVMIINGEFHAGIHDRYELDSLSSLSYTFPMYTIGEAATATILVSSKDTWQFDYQSRTDLADLCSIPLKGYSEFVMPSKRIGLNGLDTFVSFGRELLSEGSELLGRLVQQTIPNPGTKRWYFPHAACKTLFEQNSSNWGVPAQKVYLKVFPRFGNIVSASIPVALRMAQDEGVLDRGDQIALVPVSAGMVASVVQFVF